MSGGQGVEDDLEGNRIVGKPEAVIPPSLGSPRKVDPASCCGNDSTLCLSAQRAQAAGTVKTSQRG
ncbi:hypothetical protein PAJL_507 [Cutibacterium acnes HL042PA3]|nr:hypothetical protein HMPREF9578_00348 [Cutibacterium acnes HL110PA4]ESK59915.1 hypothetical protein PAJL_507 [Cutibacterium acnes HL042PA3]